MCPGRAARSTFPARRGRLYVLVTLYQAIHRGRAQPPDFLGQLGAVHALDALAFGLRFALLLLGAVALGGLMSPDRSRMLAALAFSWRSNSPSALARASRSSVLVVLLALPAAFAGAPLDGAGRWPKVAGRLGL